MPLSYDEWYDYIGHNLVEESDFSGIYLSELLEEAYENYLSEYQDQAYETYRDQQLGC